MYVSIYIIIIITSIINIITIIIIYYIYNYKVYVINIIYIYTVLLLYSLYDKFRPGRTKMHRKHAKTPTTELHAWSQHVSRSMSTGFRECSACGSQIFLHAMRASFTTRFMAQQFWRCQLRAKSCGCCSLCHGTAGLTLISRLHVSLRNA